MSDRADLEQMEKFKLFTELAEEFGWDCFASPNCDGNDEVDGIIVGNSAYVDKVLSYLPDDLVPFVTKKPEKQPN